MRKFLAALLGLALIATSPEQTRAATIYVDNIVGDDNIGDGSVGAPYATFGKGVDNASSGDVIQLVASAVSYGNYTFEYNYSGWTSLTIRGDSTAASKTQLGAITFYPHGYNFPNITFNGIRFASSFAVNTGYPTSYNADGLHVRNCVFTRDVTINDSNSRFASCRIGTDSSACHFRVMANYRNITCVGTSNTVKVRPTPGSTGEADDGIDYLFALRATPNPPNVYIAPTWTSNTITVAVPSGFHPPKIVMWQGWNNGRFGSNTMTVKDSTGQQYTDLIQWAWRDNLRNNLWDNNTFEIKNYIAGKGSVTLFMPSTGESVEGINNVYRYNTFKSNVQTQGPAFNVQWQFSPGDSFVRNVVACSTGVGNSGFFVSKARGVAVVDHNTFALFGGGGGGAFRLSPTSTCPAFVGPLILTNNIFYTGGSTSTSASQYAAYLSYRNDATLFSNYNCYAHYGSSGNHAIFGGQCGGTDAFRAVGENSSRCASTGRDCASFVDKPLFHDSTYTTFDARLDSLSACLGTGAGGGNVGAKDGAFVSSTTDVTAPSAISDLSYSVALQDRITLQWTSTGDDTSSGTATKYLIRYSTATLTEDNFYNGSAPGDPPTPLVAGTVQTKLISGLSSGTTYYFAIKVVDEAGNVGAISNVLSVTIPSRGGSVSP